MTYRQIFSLFSVFRTSVRMLFGISVLISITCRALLSVCLVIMACEMLFIRWVIKSLLGIGAQVKMLLYCCGTNRCRKQVSCHVGVRGIEGKNPTDKGDRCLQKCLDKQFPSRGNPAGSRTHIHVAGFTLGNETGEMSKVSQRHFRKIEDLAT